MDGWNTSFLLGWPIFRCYVSFRECIYKCRSLELRWELERLFIFFNLQLLNMQGSTSAVIFLDYLHGHILSHASCITSLIPSCWPLAPIWNHQLKIHCHSWFSQPHHPSPDLKVMVLHGASMRLSWWRWQLFHLVSPGVDSFIHHLFN